MSEIAKKIDHTIANFVSISALGSEIKTMQKKISVVQDKHEIGMEELRSRLQKLRINYENLKIDHKERKISRIHLLEEYTLLKSKSDLFGINYNVTNSNSIANRMMIIVMICCSLRGSCLPTKHRLKSLPLLFCFGGIRFRITSAWTSKLTQCLEIIHVKLVMHKSERYSTRRSYISAGVM